MGVEAVLGGGACRDRRGGIRGGEGHAGTEGAVLGWQGRYYTIRGEGYAGTEGAVLGEGYAGTEGAVLGGQGRYCTIRGRGMQGPKGQY